MYLEGHDEDGLSGIGSKLKKLRKKVTRPITKVAKKVLRPVVLNPALALSIKGAQRRTQAPLRRVAALLDPRGGTRNARGWANRLREPVLPVVNKALTFEPKPAVMLPSVDGEISPPAPAASIPVDDYEDDGSELTVEERAAFIDDAQPRTEPYSSGYVVDEESFEPDVPEMIEPQDLQPQQPKKQLSLPVLGGIFMLLNFL